MRVLVGGVFDIIHPGHIFFLEKAAAMGDELIVVAASDATVFRRKEKQPRNSQAIRVENLQIIDSVSKAVPGKDGDFLDVVREEKPDLIVLGYDQEFPGLEKGLKKAKLDVKIVKLKEKLDDYSTSKILAGRQKG